MDEPKLRTVFPFGAETRPSKLSDEEKRVAANDRRRNPTPSEQMLWERLEGKKLLGFGFVRERKIKGWWADFYCAAAKLVIEVDGGIHETRKAQDVLRDEVMGADLYKVLRVPAWRVFTEIDSVVEEIARHLDNVPARRRRDELNRKSEERRKASATRPPRRPRAPRPSASPGQQPPRPVRRQFCCSKCDGRTFIIDVYDRSAVCRRCHSGAHLAPVCSVCQRPKPGAYTERSWRCRECKDVHDVAHRAAGRGERAF